MKNKVADLFKELKEMPFPALGKVVGDFGLYDSVLAGVASSFLQGSGVHFKGDLRPDEESEQMLSVLKKKQKLNKQETEFLKYAGVLERLRSEIIKTVRGGPSQVPDSKSQAAGQA